MTRPATARPGTPPLTSTGHHRHDENTGKGGRAMAGTIRTGHAGTEVTGSGR
jgi:hypothetical protein